MIFLAAAILACSPTAAAVPEIRLGMTQREFAAACPPGPQLRGSGAGVSPTRGWAAPAAHFRNGRMEQFSASFDAKDFDRIRTGILARNASLHCIAKEYVSVCYDPDGTFVLTRSGDLTTLLLQTQRMADEARNAIEQDP
jgi:hypothetical protein